MAEQFYTILTSIGKTKIANISALGKLLNLTKFVLGDGNGMPYNPVETQTSLKKEVWRGQINSIEIDNDNPNWIVISTLVPITEGGFTIREAGVLDDEGNLIAIGKYPETYKPVLSEGSSKDLYVKLIIEVSNTSSVTIKVDPTVVLATKADIQNLNNKVNSLKDKDIRNSEGETLEEVTNEINEHLNNTDLSVSNVLSGYKRQAIINGNFDVCQRGYSFDNPAKGQYTADRWFVDHNVSSSTPPSITHSIKAVGAEELLGSRNKYEISFGGAGIFDSVFSYYAICQRIEFGTRLLCGGGKKVTVSFKAKSENLTGKRLGVGLQQNYGTGGNPSPYEALKGKVIELTNSWQEYSVTFETNSTVGKIFGSNNDDFLAIYLFLEWGGNLKDNYLQDDDELETSFIGQGKVCIAQVQVSEGEETFPFMYKTYADELINCWRYFYAIPGNIMLRVSGYSPNDLFFNLFVPVTMRTMPTLIPGTSPPAWSIMNLALNTTMSGFSLYFHSGWGNNSVLRATKTSHGMTDVILKGLGAGMYLDAEIGGN